MTAGRTDRANPNELGCSWNLHRGIQSSRSLGCPEGMGCHREEKPKAELVTDCFEDHSPWQAKGCDYPTSKSAVFFKGAFCWANRRGHRAAPAMHQSFGRAAKPPAGPNGRRVRRAAPSSRRRWDSRAGRPVPGARVPRPPRGSARAKGRRRQSRTGRGSRPSDKAGRPSGPGPANELRGARTKSSPRSSASRHARLRRQRVVGRQDHHQRQRGELARVELALGDPAFLADSATSIPRFAAGRSCSAGKRSWSTTLTCGCVRRKAVRARSR